MVNSKIEINRTIILITTGVILIISSGYTLLARTYTWWPFSQKIIQSSDSNNTQNITTNTSPKNNNVATKTEQTSTKTTDQVPTNSEAMATLIQLEQVGENVLVTAKIDHIAANGNCVVTFTNPNDRPITKEFSPVDKDGVILCSTSISAYEFSFLGTWHAAVRYYQDNKQVTAEGDVKIS